MESLRHENRTSQEQEPGTNVFFDHARAKLRLVELAHYAIHPSETTFVPICFYKRAYLNGSDLNNSLTRVLQSPAVPRE